MENQIAVKPIAGTLGAEIEGVDLSAELSNQQFDAIHGAFLQHNVIFFCDQKALSPGAHKAFGQRFGSLNVAPLCAGDGRSSGDSGNHQRAGRTD